MTLLKDSLILGLVVILISFIIAIVWVKRSAQKANANKDKKLPPATENIQAKLKQAGFEQNRQKLLLETISNKRMETEKTLKRQWFSPTAWEQFKQENYTPAEILFTRWVSKRPFKAARGAYYLGNIKFIQLHFEQALDFYQKAAMLYPYHPIYLNEAGSANHLLGKNQEALKYFEQSLALCRKATKNKPNLQTATALNNLSVVRQALGNQQQAREYATQTYNMYVALLGKDDPGTLKSLRYLNSLSGK